MATAYIKPAFVTVCARMHRPTDLCFVRWRRAVVEGPAVERRRRRVTHRLAAEVTAGEHLLRATRRRRRRRRRRVEAARVDVQLRPANIPRRLS